MGMILQKFATEVERLQDELYVLLSLFPLL